VRSADRVAVWRNHIPRSTELRHRLAQDLSRALVADVVVERVTSVGDLEPAVRPPDGAYKPGWSSSSRTGRPLGDNVRRPGGGACTITRAAGRAIMGEEVESDAACINEGRPIGRARNPHGPRLSQSVSHWIRRRCGRIDGACRDRSRVRVGRLSGGPACSGRNHQRRSRCREQSGSHVTFRGSGRRGRATDATERPILRGDDGHHGGHHLA
jgi:hypothetical protein